MNDFQRACGFAGLKHTTCILQLDKFVTIKDRQFSKAKLRRAAAKYKRCRKSLKEIRKRTTKIKESIEGTTYESGIGADQTAKQIMEIIDHPSPHVYKAIEWMKESVHSIEMIRYYRAIANAKIEISD